MSNSEKKGSREAVDRMAHRMASNSRGTVTFEQAKKVAVDAFRRNESGRGTRTKAKK